MTAFFLLLTAALILRYLAFESSTRLQHHWEQWVAPGQRFCTRKAATLLRERPALREKGAGALLTLQSVSFGFNALACTALLLLCWSFPAGTLSRWDAALLRYGGSAAVTVALMVDGWALTRLAVALAPGNTRS